MRLICPTLCVLALTVCAFAQEPAAEGKPRPYAPSSIPGEKWKDLQLKVVKPKGEHDLLKALDTAKRAGKYTFIQVGRQNCTNTMQLWHMLADGRVKIPDNFVYADISRDDDAMRMEFESRFALEEDGFWLPYVVIVGPDGSQLASCAGRHTPDEYNALIKRAIADYEGTPTPAAKTSQTFSDKPFAESAVPTPEGCEQIAVKKRRGEHDLDKAIEDAKKQGKFLLVQMGRTNCTNCQKVWNMIGDGRVKIPDDFLYADVSCDDEATLASFFATFSVTDSGRLYPYIVIMAPDGSQMEFRSGLGTPEEYNAMIEKSRADYAAPAP